MIITRTAQSDTNGKRACVGVRKRGSSYVIYAYIVSFIYTAAAVAVTGSRERNKSIKGYGVVAAVDDANSNRCVADQVRGNYLYVYAYLMFSFSPRFRRLSSRLGRGFSHIIIRDLSIALYTAISVRPIALVD